MQPPASSASPRGDRIEDITTLFFVTVAVVAAAGLFLTSEHEMVEIIFGSISDAYVQVTTFVAGTFLLIYGAERFLKFDAVAALRRETSWQVPMAAALGAMPGCAGAVIVVTQFVTGRLSFGSVVATLTATMGDAAFLLLAQEPLTGLSMIMLGFGVGTVTGWVVNLIHSRDFLRGNGTGTECSVLGCPLPEDRKTRSIDVIWMAVLLPGIVLGLLAAFQIDVDAILGNASIEAPATLVGVVGGTLAVAMRLMPRRKGGPRIQSSMAGSPVRRTVEDTNFITIWVISAFLVFELSVYWLNLDLHAFFDGWAIFTPLIAVLLGFLPGCGPQVLVTTMYLAGLIPLSAQIGNTISNDGDALFPAIAIAPKVAIVATLYSAVPAVIVAYGWLFWME